MEERGALHVEVKKRNKGQRDREESRWNEDERKRIKMGVIEKRKGMEIK